MVIGQAWIALKPEYCIRERQLVRSQNRLSYERGWVRRRGGGGAGEAVDTGMESRGREWGAQEEAEEEMVRWWWGSSSPGRCGAEGDRPGLFVVTVAAYSPVREREEEGAGRSVGPLRSEEDAEAPLVSSLQRTHRCSQTSGLTLITHIHEEEGEEGEEEQKNHTPFLLIFVLLMLLSLSLPTPCISLTPCFRSILCFTFLSLLLNLNHF